GQDFYKRIMEKLKDRDVKIIVDTSGKALKDSLGLKPYLIKPNLRELEGIFNLKIKDKKDLSSYSKKLQERGARNIIVSLGKEGAYMICENGEEYFCQAPEGRLVDSVGSGDSMVAGFVYAKDKGLSNEEAFKFSIASGSATAFSENLGTKEEIYSLYEKM
ncbi:MAG: PfkB family carbohydrate kinase, partial [Peptoniphilus sp.]|nr:PfkB family carbohydrate kinase [Peptoniphilus sp.]